MTDIGNRGNKQILENKQKLLPVIRMSLVVNHLIHLSHSGFRRY